MQLEIMSSNTINLNLKTNLDSWRISLAKRLVANSKADRHEYLVLVRLIAPLGNGKNFVREESSMIQLKAISGCTCFCSLVQASPAVINPIIKHTKLGVVR